jgi:hypothetical protein
MFAILISEENRCEIETSGVLQFREIDTIDVYMRASSQYVLVRGWTTPRGEFKPWTVLPLYILEESYDYDPNKIKIDWDQIVRK